MARTQELDDGLGRDHPRFLGNLERRKLPIPPLQGQSGIRRDKGELANLSHGLKRPVIRGWDDVAPGKLRFQPLKGLPCG